MTGFPPSTRYRFASPPPNPSGSAASHRPSVDELFRLDPTVAADDARHPAGTAVPVPATPSDALDADWLDAERRVLAARAAGFAPAAAGGTAGRPVVPDFVRRFIGFGDVGDPGRAITVFRCAAALAEAGFLAATGRRAAPVPSPPPRKGQKPHPVVEKVVGYRRFFEAAAGADPRPSAGAVAAWCWLWTGERDGRARCSVRRLAARLGVSRTTAGRWLAELVAAGFVRVVRPGRRGTTATAVRVRPTPSRRRG